MQINFSHCHIRLIFEYGKIDNRLMQLTVEHNQTIYPVSPIFEDNTGHAELKFVADLPTVINFLISGKGVNDTIVDSQGNIIQDCYIKITGLFIDGFEIKPGAVDRNISVFTENNQQFTTHYLGFNGRAELRLSKSNVMSQVLFLNQI